VDRAFHVQQLDRERRELVQSDQQDSFEGIIWNQSSNPQRFFHDREGVWNGRFSIDCGRKRNRQRIGCQGNSSTERAEIGAVHHDQLRRDS